MNIKIVLTYLSCVTVVQSLEIIDKDDRNVDDVESLRKNGTLPAFTEGDGVYKFRYKDQVAKISEGTYEELNIFCVNATEPAVYMFWHSFEFKLDIRTDYYSVYVGRNASVVRKMHDEYAYSLWTKVFPKGQKNLKMNPFESNCYGILARDEYAMTFVVYNVNYWFVCWTLAGLGLFFYAKKLCRNVLCHYTTGVAIGILGSLILLTYFVQKKFGVRLTWALCSYSLATYFMTSFFYNIGSYLMEYVTFFFGYVVVAGVLSFMICYRMGPIENPRSLDLIQWTLQAAALAMIAFSSYYQAASITLALAILLWSAIPAKLKAKVQVEYHRRIRKPKARLLSEREYFDQSRVETERALNELRSFCKSPKCDAWRTTSRLRSPTRFAEFVQGSSHLTQEEVMNYSHVEYDDESEDGDENAEDNSPNPPLTDDNTSDDEIDLPESYGSNFVADNSP